MTPSFPPCPFLASQSPRLPGLNPQLHEARPYYPRSCPHDQSSPAPIPITDSSRPFSRDPSRAPGSIRLTQRVNLTSHHEHIIKHQPSHDTCPSPVSGKVQRPPRAHAHIITHIMHPTPAKYHHPTLCHNPPGSQDKKTHNHPPGSQDNKTLTTLPDQRQVYGLDLGKPQWRGKKRTRTPGFIVVSYR